MEVSREKLRLIEKLFNKTDLENTVRNGESENGYETEIKAILDRLDSPTSAEQVEEIIREVFYEKYDDRLNNDRYMFVPKLSSDVYRVLILPSFKRIEKIKISYTSPDKDPGYAEYVCIDGINEEIIYNRKLGDIRSFTNTYYVPHNASSFIDEYSLLFQYFGEDNSKYDPDTPEVEILVFYEGKTIKRIRRSYNRYGMPKEWNELIDDLGTLIYTFGWFGSLFSENIYGKGLMDDEYIYLSVVFNDYGKEYYYRTDDDSICVGDYVIVPVIDYETKRTVRVVKKEYFKEKDVPMPLDMVKTVISKKEPSGRGS